MSKGLGKTQRIILDFIQQDNNALRYGYIAMAKIYSHCQQIGILKASVSRAISGLCERGYLKHSTHRDLRVMDHDVS